MRRVQVESPFAPQTTLADCTCDKTRYEHRARCPSIETRMRRDQEAARNRRYLAACLADCIRRGETPYASHGLLTLPGVLDDTKPEERAKGIAAGFAMREAMHATVFYTDLGWSGGMLDGEADAEALRVDGKRHPIEHRTLGAAWDK